jgi:hypothetical protein
MKPVNSGDAASGAEVLEADGGVPGVVAGGPASPLHLPHSAGQCQESRRRLSAGGLAGWNGYHAELD